MPPKRRKPDPKTTATRAKKIVVVEAAADPKVRIGTAPSLLPAKLRPRAASVSPSPARPKGFESLTEAHFSKLQTLHLVVDLDATFVCTRTEFATHSRAMDAIDKMNPEIAKEVKSRMFVFNLDGTKMWTLLRPGATKFLEFASFYFKRVSVWSAGQADYITQIVSFLFPPHIPRPGLIFTWDDCKIGTADDKKDLDAASPSHSEIVSFSKPLTAIIEQASETGDTLANTLILDDRTDIAIGNMENLIHIPAFEPRLTPLSLSSQDNAFAQFTKWLMSPEVLSADDIRKVPKDGIFH